MELIAQQEVIEGRIYMIRGHKVMLSADLAELYGVEPRALIQAVKRNMERFPDDFMFMLSNQEVISLKSQIVISSWGGRRANPYAFTEQGVAMLSSVLHSKRAVQVNIAIMRAFVKLRQMLSSNKKLSRKLALLENRIERHNEEIKVKESRLRWHDWQRYSARQGSKLKMGGFVGEITFEGNIAPFMSLIKAGEVLHVSKGTSFGLGKYEIL